MEAAVKNVLPITMRACHFSTASDDPTDAIALRKYISHECRCEVSGCDVMVMVLLCWSLMR